MSDVIVPETLFAREAGASRAGGEMAVSPAPRLVLRHPPKYATPLDPGRLKILVVGTPKAGNTWIKHLLSVVYQLPIVSLHENFSANDWVALGPRWIGQQHYDPTPDIRAWADRENAVFVAPIRHPGDVLISLRHYVLKRGVAPTDNSLEPGFMLKDPPGVHGIHTQVFLQHGFPLLLHLSIYWLRRNWAHAVRYEDLWRFPLETLRALTSQILPVTDRTLHHALCACEIDLMRTTVNPSGDLVRKGGIGAWREELPPVIKAELAGEEPYPDQFCALGYTMDETEDDNLRVVESAAIENPFRSQSAFANGVALSPILLRLYFDLPIAQTVRWPDATATGPDSYFAWLRQPAAADPEAGHVAPVVTELALALRSLRPDLVEAFPDPFGGNRVEFCHWFIFNATGEFEFDRSFTLPVLASWARGRAVG